MPLVIHLQSPYDALVAGLADGCSIWRKENNSNVLQLNIVKRTLMGRKVVKKKKDRAACHAAIKPHYLLFHYLGIHLSFLVMPVGASKSFTIDSSKALRVFVLSNHPPWDLYLVSYSSLLLK